MMKISLQVKASVKLSEQEIKVCSSVKNLFKIDFGTSLN